MRYPFLLTCLILAAVPAFGQDVNPLSLGISDYRDESFEEAIDSLKEARQAQPASFEAALYLGLSYKAVQDFGAARGHLQEATRLRPSSGEAHFALAETLYHLGEYNEAAVEVRTAAERGYRPGDTHFLKGLILVKSGRPDEAVTSFAAAKAADPSLAQSADLHAGLAYMEANRYDEAARSLQEAVVRDPATDLAEYAREYTRAIARRKERERPLRLSASLRLEYDDNVILKPADEAAASGITGEGDVREALTFRAEHTKRWGGPWSLRSQYSLYATNQHDLESHEVISNTIGLTPSYNLSNGTLSAPVAYANTLVAGSHYLDSIAITPSWSRALGSNGMFSVSLRLQKREFKAASFSAEEDRDSMDTALSAAWYRFFGNGGFLVLRYEVNGEDADGANWDYLGNKGSVNILYPAGEKLKIQAFAEYLAQDFKRQNTFFSVKREDRVFTGSVLATYAVTEKADFVVQYTRVRDESNIAIYDYERDIFSAGVDYRF